MDGGDWLDFLAALLPTILWVGLIAFVVFMLRGPIKSALSSGDLKRIKAGPGGFEAEWHEKLKEAQEQIAKASQASLEAGDSEDHFSWDSGGHRPLTRIGLAYEGVAGALAGLVVAADPQDKDELAGALEREALAEHTLTELSARALQQHLISYNLDNALRALDGLYLFARRDEHDPFADADEYVRTAALAMDTIEGITKSLRDKNDSTDV